MAGNASAPATGLSYRSTISGRLLGTDVDITAISPMLREGRPPRPEDAKAMATAPKRKLGAFVYQPKAVGISTAMVPLSAVRGVSVSTVEGAGSTYRPGEAQAATDYAAAVAEEPSDAASAGSYLPSGPANNDPDGISAAVSTMRRFRRMLEAGHSKSKGAPPIFQPMREHNTRFDAAAGPSGHGHGGDDDADGTDVDWNSTVMPSGKPLLNGASADLASAVSANAAGTSVVGTLVVKRNCLMRATMIAAKWTRIVNTQYGASAADPVCIVVEMQRTYHTAFLDDMHEATGGDFMFKTEPAPTAIVANIGAINLLLKAGETDFSKHLLPPHASNSKKRFTVIGGTLAARSLAGQGDAISIARAASEFGTEEGWPEAGGDSSLHAASGSAAGSTALVRYRGGSSSPTRGPRGGAHSGSSAAGAGGREDTLATLDATGRSRDGGGFDGGDGGTVGRAGASHGAVSNGGGTALAKFGGSRAAAAMELGSSGGRGGGPAALSDPFGADTAGLDAEMRTKAKYEAPLVYRGEVAVSKAVLDSQEFLTEKRKGLLRAGRKLRAAAVKGDTKELARLVIRGEAIYFDPRPWYLRDMRAVDNPEGDTPANNPHVVKTDAVVRPTVDWCEADGMTALMHAVRAGNPDSVRALAEMGADSHRKCKEGLHAIDMARTACDEASEALRRHLRGAVEARKRAAEVVAILDTRTIWEAVQDGDQHRLRILLNTGAAAVNAANPYGMTALHFAVINRDAEAALLLVKHGANPHRRNNLGQTPASLLEEIEAKGTKAKLLEAFSGGKAEDAERRARDRAKLSQEAADQALLLTFERKLRTLTRGTTAAKTLRALNDLSKAAARPAAGGGGGTAGRGRSASPTRGGGGGPAGGASRPATGFGTRPGSRAAGTFLLGADAVDARPATASTAALPPMSPFALDRSRPSTSVRGSKLIITSAEAVRYSGQPGAAGAGGGGGHASASSGAASGGGDAMTDLYAASHQRHARDYIALAMKEQQVAGAKALGASLARSGPLSPASRGGGGGLGSPGSGGASAAKLTSDDVEHHAFERFFAAKAPHPADRKFDVYFKAHTGGRLQV